MSNSRSDKQHLVQKSPFPSTGLLNKEGHGKKLLDSLIAEIINNVPVICKTNKQNLLESLIAEIINTVPVICTTNKRKLLDSLIAEFRATVLVLCKTNKQKLLDSLVAEVRDIVIDIQILHFIPPPKKKRSG